MDSRQWKRKRKGNLFPAGRFCLCHLEEEGHWCCIETKNNMTQRGRLLNGSNSQDTPNIIVDNLKYPIKAGFERQMKMFVFFSIFRPIRVMHDMPSCNLEITPCFDIIQLTSILNSVNVHSLNFT